MNATYPVPNAVQNPYAVGPRRARVVVDGRVYKDSIGLEQAEAIAASIPGAVVEEQPTTPATVGLDWNA